MRGEPLGKTIYRGVFKTFGKTLEHSACVPVYTPLLCKKYVLKHFCDLFEIKLWNLQYNKVSVIGYKCFRVKSNLHKTRVLLIL